MGLLSWAQKRAIRKLQKRGEWGISMAQEAIPDLADLAARLSADLERALREQEARGQEKPQKNPLEQ